MLQAIYSGASTMANSYPYPAAEHLQPVVTPYDVIDEELRYYRSGPELRRGIIGIGKIYRKTLFMIGLQKYARLMKIAQLTNEVSSELDRPALPANFYVGEILATHHC